nr:HIF1a pathway protein [Daphnia magna]
MQQFISGLKSRNEDSRLKAARDLHHYVTSELREALQEDVISFVDDLNHHIFDMVSSSDVNEKKGGILAIVSLLQVDVGNTNARMTRFANYLKNLLPSQDVVVMELTARALGKLTLVSGSYTAEYVEFEVKRAFEWLSGERNEGRRHAAVLVLRELALSTPTFFFQQVQTFFDVIFYAVRDSKLMIREGAVTALRSALVVTSQRETKEAQKPTWYKQCFDEAQQGFEEPLAKDKGLTKDDRAHGSLLVLQELLRCSNAEGERLLAELEQLNSLHSQTVQDSLISTTSRVLPNGAVELINTPSLYNNLRLLPGHVAQSRIGSAVSPLSIVAPQQYPIVESAACRQLTADHFDDICANTLRHSISKSVHVQAALMGILPRLAAYDRTRFSDRYLNTTMGYLMTCVNRKEKNQLALITIGYIAVCIEGDIAKYLPGIINYIRTTLPQSKDPSTKKRSTPPDVAVFVCLSLLGRALGRSHLTTEFKELLDPMLSVGLSPALTTCLRELALRIPLLKKDIAEGLLRMLSLVLMHQPLRHPGMPKHLMALNPVAIQPLASAGDDVNNTVLALRTLGNFDFQGQPLLLQFVRHCADHFLCSEQRAIRLEAVRTCSQLLKCALQESVKLKKKPLRSSGVRLVSATVAEVLSKLLTAAITDPDASVRYCVFASLDPHFFSYLALAENLGSITVALNDEVFEIREMAVCIIGHLSSMNPAYIMPALRKLLIQLLTELEHSGMGRNKEQSSRLLGRLVSSAPRLIKPYMEPILKILVPKLKENDPNPGVTIAVLTAIGDLAQVSESEMRLWSPELLPLLLDMLADSSLPAKREVALWTLAQLIESTGCVIQPYQEFPSLLELLLSFLKTEQLVSIRRETLRVLGLLGALDPYKHKMNLGHIDSQGDSSAVMSMSDGRDADSFMDSSASEMLVNMNYSSLEEFYPAVAIATLMRVVKDQTLSQHHNTVVNAVMFIFKSLGVRCVPYIKQVVPSFVNVVRFTPLTEVSLKEFLFQQLGFLIAIVKQHIRPYLDQILDLVKEHWTVNSPFQITIILLIEHVAMALGAEFKMYLPLLVPLILRVLTHDASKDRSVTGKLLQAVQKFGSNLEDYLHLLLPPIVKLFDAIDVNINVRRTALETVDFISDTLDLSDFASRIIQPLVRCIENTSELRPVAMETLASLVAQLGKKYLIFIPMVQKVLVRHRIQHQRYDVLVAKILHGGGSVDEEDLSAARQRRGNSKAKEGLISSDTTAVKRLHVAANNLQRAWTATRRVSKDDWQEWLRKLSSEMLKESPSPPLRSCWALGQSYIQLPRDLFNAAFVSCWTELSQQHQNELVKSLEQALRVPDLPEITQTILNLAEFMEHCEKGPLPLDAKLLGQRAMQCRAYAKALHYKEAEFHESPTAQVLESLISINNKLQQKEAAAGLLEYAMKKHEGEIRVQERWHEKLHDWERALEAYRKKEINQQQQEPELVLGQMRCLEALCEWGQLHTLAEANWKQVNADVKNRFARMAAAAAWGLGKWTAMEEYVNFIPKETQDGAFYRSVLAIHREQYSQAQTLIDSARDLLDTELTALSGESYQRAYGAMVLVQMLAELEEVIQYKILPERRGPIRKIWWQRLQGCQRIVEDWQKIIQVHSLVISPEEDMRTWLKYSSLCRKSGRLALSHKTLVTLLGTDPSLNPDHPLPTLHPHVTYAYSKHLWMSNQKEQAFRQLHHFVQASLQPQSLSSISTTPVSTPEEPDRQVELGKLLARCYLRLGQWQECLQGINELSIPAVLQYYAAATEHDSTWYKAWHSWAYMNFEAVLFYKHQGQNTSANHTLMGDVSASGGLTAQHVSSYTVPAVQGFFRSIALSHGSSLQDTLRLLTLWFDYGHWPEVYEALVEGIRTIDVNTWLQVIPQLIARIDTQRQLVGRLIHQLLMDIGKAHPQALIYPLTVASKSALQARHNAANKILKNMCEHSPVLVQQAVMVSEELIRVAILWHELWHEGLEEASRLYFGERNVTGMFATLEPLHAMLERGPQTLKETSFHQAYGRELLEAQDWCRRYKTSLNVRDLNQAWDLYYHVFRRISRQLPQLTSLELQYVSPKLLLCRDLELAIPGSYVPNQPVIRISQVNSSLQVITSKQRPRKLCITGSNGKEYMFLLKGHEDLRQDERVMQLFSLVNTLLIHDPETFRRNLTIQRYAVIPLSTNSGLIGWVPHCDTLHSLIRDYREKKKILLNIEHRIMLRMAPDYDHLSLMQKVEVFEHALEHTQGDDLAKILWLRSPSSEVWFDRRTNYTRSLAVMSMVGYILGLGDRHPSNLMLDRLSGKILHIDFGDCFEVAMTREKFPEKIPFRLTRMLVNAMEVTGIEGTYRSTCESVMAVLRGNKDSLMAVLEAFVYDPLLNWRLVVDNVANTKTTRRSKSRHESSSNNSAQGDVGDSMEITANAAANSSSVLNAAISRSKNDIAEATANDGPQPEILNKRALTIVSRVRDKLTGRDFPNETEGTLGIDRQVELLIQQATSHENLCQCYIGWCPFW